MTISRVQTQTTNGWNVSTSVSGSWTQDNRIVLIVGLTIDSPTGPIGSSFITVNQAGVTWNLLTFSNIPADDSAIGVYVSNPLPFAPGSNININFNDVVNFSVVAAEYSGLQLATGFPSTIVEASNDSTGTAGANWDTGAIVAAGKPSEYLGIVGLVNTAPALTTPPVPSAITQGFSYVTSASEAGPVNARGIRCSLVERIFTDVFGFAASVSGLPDATTYHYHATLALLNEEIIDTISHTTDSSLQILTEPLLDKKLIKNIPAASNTGLVSVSILGVGGNNTLENAIEYVKSEQEVVVSKSSIAELSVTDPIVKKPL